MWEDIVKMDLREIGWGDMDWINFSQGIGNSGRLF
jgi:hypothetical protein